MINTSSQWLNLTHDVSLSTQKRSSVFSFAEVGIGAATFKGHNVHSLPVLKHETRHKASCLRVSRVFCWAILGHNLTRSKKKKKKGPKSLTGFLSVLILAGRSYLSYCGQIATKIDAALVLCRRSVHFCCCWNYSKTKPYIQAFCNCFVLWYAKIRCFFYGIYWRSITHSGSFILLSTFLMWTTGHTKTTFESSKKIITVYVSYCFWYLIRIKDLELCIS